MALVKDDDSVEILNFETIWLRSVDYQYLSTPLKELLQATVVSRISATPALTDQRRVSAEDDALLHGTVLLATDLGVLELVQRIHGNVFRADVPEIALSVVFEIRGNTEPNCTRAAENVILVDDRGNGSAFSHASAITYTVSGWSFGPTVLQLAVSGFCSILQLM